MENSQPAIRQTERYQFQSGLASGGFATVFTAWDNQLNRTVAIKRLVADHLRGEKRGEALREAMRLAALKHPNIVTVYDFGEDAHGAFVVMEYVQGETLEKVVERGVLVEDDFVSLASQCLEGLTAAHHSGMVHRDFKPRNVMVSPLPNGQFQVKILDFGLSRFMDITDSYSVDESSEIFGSVHIMPPEQLRRENFDARSDLYGLGCTLYFALAGVMPFEGPMVADVIAAHLQHLVTPLAEHRPDLPPWLCAWVMRLIEFDRDARFSSAPEALAALRQMRESSLVPQPAEVRPAKKFPVVPTAIAAACVAVAGAGAWHFWPKSATSANAAAGAASAAVAAPTERPSFRVLAPTDLDVARSLLGQTVAVEGVPVGIGRSRSGTARYVNFTHDFRQTIALVFFVAPEDETITPKLKDFVGKPIRALGRLEEHKGALQIVVRDPADVLVR